MDILEEAYRVFPDPCSIAVNELEFGKCKIEIDHAPVIVLDTDEFKTIAEIQTLLEEQHNIDMKSNKLALFVFGKEIPLYPEKTLSEYQIQKLSLKPRDKPGDGKS
jgi:hypothetical protein